MYKNPINTSSIISSLTDCVDLNQVLTLISKVFPNWIIGLSHGYSDDYPHFQSNWNVVCKKMNCKPREPIIVDFIPVKFDDTNSIILTFCEVLTRFGYPVRRKEEFSECKHCEKLIPSKVIYDKLKTNNIKIPSIWMNKCQSC